ncbi:hypothetical protein P7D22_10660 [Lichenihabitans sp. Uapishka_5]|uniref:hypothetical protein n=1 Tax=Lichenihabitans sp. Uapishka_5 TaxID=3037302 RepID=UPI0029E7F62D|nr:hypothetical protein [Lichenihabitans sp. Uapishka_5]MDX7951628.1 hypothetical protein [Lichenihabitans sp. Uapishka_5]
MIEEPTSITAELAVIPAEMLAMYADGAKKNVTALAQMIDAVGALREGYETLYGGAQGEAADELLLRSDHLCVSLTMANLDTASDRAKRDAILARALRSRRLPMGPVARSIVEGRKAFDRPRGTSRFWRAQPHAETEFEIDAFICANLFDPSEADTSDPTSLLGLVRRFEVAQEHLDALHDAGDERGWGCQEHCRNVHVLICLTRASDLREAVVKVNCLVGLWRASYQHNARVYLVCEVAIRAELDRWNGSGSPTISSRSH